jgi:hypothetical protein
MDAKMKSTMATVMGVLAIPLAGLVLYGMYFVFTYKAKPKPPEPKIDTFRADGKPKEVANDSKDVRKKKPVAKTDEPVAWDVELVWEVENAEQITIEPGVGKVEPKGSTHVEINKNTTYVLKAKNITGEVTYSLDVDVVPAEQ